MTLTYSQFSDKTASEKVLLCHIEPRERLLLWTLDSGSVYVRAVSYFVIDTREGSTSLTEGSSSTLSAGEWFYDSAAGNLYIRTSDSSNPNTKNVSVDYRLFFANGPYSLPYDLLTGADVYYEPLIQANSAISKDIDEEQIGLAIESNTSITFENTGGYFDSIFDTLFFENKTVRLYSWSPTIPLSEKQLLFQGTIEDKGFSDGSAKFKCKDDIYKLRKKMQTGLFSSSDGNVPDAFLGSAKRRIYGKFDNLKCTPVDSILAGFTLTGTLSAGAGGTTVIGVGTSFLDEVSPNDEITANLGFGEIIMQVESVDSDTQLTISDALDNNIPIGTYTNKPERPWRKKNRNWHIAGHKLRAPSTTISAVNQNNRIEVNDITDFEAGDLIDVNGEDAYIRRVVDSEIILEQNLQTTPIVTDPVVKNPVTSAYLNEKTSFINRDWTVTNTTEAILNLENDAEFNVARTKDITGTFVFTNGSRDVTVTSKDISNNLRPRDWIRTTDLTHTTWYEVLSVDDAALELRVAYAGTNHTGTAQIKNPVLIDENSLITVDCVGIESSGAWIRYPGSVVDHILQTDASITNINAASITTADIEGRFLLSLAIPEDIGKSAPVIRDVITKINKSCFGSLVTNSAWEFKYQILTPEKPEDLTALKDDDVIDWKVNSNNQIVRQINAKYRPFVDRFTGEDTFSDYEYTNDFVDTYIEATDEKDVTLYLYNLADATLIAQRYGLYASLSQSVVTVTGKLNLFLNNINDKMWINFDRLYNRFGNRDRQKIGIINKITRTSSDVTIDFNDLGNVFNRVMSIAPDTAADFTSATDNEKLFNAYICDDNLEVPDITSDQELGTQIIG
jgi:hypothetical protein